MTTNVLQLPLDKVKADNLLRSGEYDDQELVGLALTMREVGQLFPIIVRPDGDYYAIVDGHRRVLALQKLQRQTVDAVVQNECNEHHSLRLQWISNCQRSEIVPIDRARSIRRLMDMTGWGPTETAKRLGISGAGVSRALALLALPEPIAQQVDAGALPVSTACELAKIGDPTKQAELAEAATKGKVTRDAVSAEVKREKHNADAAGKKAVSRAVATLPGGRSISVSGDGLTLESLIAWLEELLAKARKARTRGVELTAFTRILKDDAKAL